MCFQLMSVNLAPYGGSLRPGARLALSLWVRAPDVRGPMQLHLLLLYAGGGAGEASWHRVLRVTLRLVVVDGVQVIELCRRSK